MMPFHGSLQDTPNATLLLSVAAAALTLLQVNQPPALVRTVMKTLAVGLLAVLAFVQQGPPLLAAAMALSAVGDAFLSRDGERAFLAGLASFLAAHVLYIMLFASSGGGTALLLSDPWRTTIAVLMGLSALIMIALLLPRVAPALRVPILVYVAAILVMGLAALTMSSLPVIVGAILFMASDGMLATEKFLVAAIAPGRMLMRYAVWTAYYAAQLLIALGFLLG